MSTSEDTGIQGDAGSGMPKALQQSIITEQIATQLPQRISPDWVRMHFEFRAAGDYSEGRLRVHRSDGSSETARFPHDIFDMAGELRSLMYEPGNGTWFTAVWDITSREDGTFDFSTKFDYDSEPSWSHSVSPNLYAGDMQEFPREHESIPAWLVSILQETNRS